MTYMRRFLTAGLTLCLQAQSSPHQKDTVYWHGATPWTLRSLGSEGTELIAFKGTTVKVPPAFTSVHSFEGELWALRREGDRREILTSTDGRTWASRLRLDRGTHLDACAWFRALGHDRYLVQSRELMGGGYALDRQVSKWAILKVDARGRETLEQVLPLELPARFSSYPMFFFTGLPLPCGEGWAVLYPRLGYAWSVQPGRTVRVRSGKLMGTLLDDLGSKRPADLGWALVAAQPQQDGNLLIAARRKGAVLEAPPPVSETPGPKTAFPARPAEPQSKEENRKLLQGMQKKIEIRGKQARDEAVDGQLDRKLDDPWIRRDLQGLKAHPDVDWWEFEASTAKFRRVPPPKGAPETLTTLGDFYRIAEGLPGWVKQAH